MRRIRTLHPDADRWASIGGAVTAMTAVVTTTCWLVGGVAWIGAAACAAVAAIGVATWYTLAGRTLTSPAEVRERLVERTFTGVAWYASMLRTAVAKEGGGYEKGLRTELTRLSAARLAERHGVNLYQDPDTARDLVGRDLWPLVDPAAAPGPGEAAPRVPPRVFAELVERLEQM